MKLFAVAICATRKEPPRTKQNTDGASVVTTLQNIRIASTTVRAQSEEEAIGIALKVARETWPPQEGWYDYQATVQEVPNVWILEAAKDLQGSGGK